MSDAGDQVGGIWELKYIFPGGRRYGGKIFRGDDSEDIAAATFGWELADKYMIDEATGINWNELTKRKFFWEFRRFNQRNVLTQPCADAKLVEHKPALKLGTGSGKGWRYNYGPDE